jgi:protein SCO1/2
MHDNPSSVAHHSGLPVKSIVVAVLTIFALAFAAFSATAHENHDKMDHSKMNHANMDHSKHQAQLKSAGEDAQVNNQSTLTIPNVTLLNEHGKPVAVMDDLIQDKIVVINTIFTTCTTVCPVMGLQYAQLQKKLLKRYTQAQIDQKMLLISISIDPLNDTPERLAAFKAKFGGGPGWTLLTGSQTNVEKLLKTTGLFAADPQEHTPITLVGSAHLNQWTRLSGLGPAKQIVKMVDKLTEKKSVAQQPAAQQYFTDIDLVDQHGQTQRLYTDLIKDKVVIIHPFFSTCKGSCPVAMKLMSQVATRFEEQMGKQLHILSISLDPTVDTPPKLQAYAKELKVGPGWQLLSGDKPNVDLALQKLGHYVSDIEAHKNTILIGNEATGLWKKALLLAQPAQLDRVISSVIEDQLPVTAATH